MPTNDAPGREIAPQADDLHPDTAALVDEFAVALKGKLKAAQDKYGHTNGWLHDDWQDECGRELVRHVAKGDPLDVAALTAFHWKRGWPTSLRAPQADGDVVAALREALERIAAATPRNTNNATAEGMASWCHAVARTALDCAALARAEAGSGGGETFDTIAQWCEETFGSITPPRIAERANEEMIELLADPQRVEEAADVVIVLSRYPGLWDAVQRKMAVNRGRTWRLMGDGTGYHVPPAPVTAEQEQSR